MFFVILKRKKWLKASQVTTSPISCLWVFTTQCISERNNTALFEMPAYYGDQVLTWSSFSVLLKIRNIHSPKNQGCVWDFLTRPTWFGGFLATLTQKSYISKFQTSLCSSLIQNTHCFGVSLLEGIFQCLIELYSSFSLQYIWLKRHSWPHHYYQYCSCSPKSTLQNIKEETHRCLAMRCAINLQGFWCWMFIKANFKIAWTRKHLIQDS